MSILSNVAIQWLIRRVPEWGGIIATIVATIALAPPDVTANIQTILSGQGGGLSVTAYLGLISWIYAQIISFRATNRPQAVVYEEGKLVTNTLAPGKENQVADVVTNVSSHKSLIEILTGK